MCYLGLLTCKRLEQPIWKAMRTRYRWAPISKQQMVMCILITNNYRSNIKITQTEKLRKQIYNLIALKNPVQFV